MFVAEGREDFREKAEVFVGYTGEAPHESARINVSIKEDVHATAHLTPQEAKAMAHALLIEADRAVKELGWR